MEYISDVIGEDYKKWMERDSIFISSPTGSGKTTFILNTFLPYLKSKRKKVLYLVNRTILKEQLKKEIDDLPLELREMIRIELYQTVENKIANLSWETRSSDEFIRGYCAAMCQMVPKENLKEYIYQISRTGKGNYFADGYSRMKEYSEYDCVVCDEAHYFLMDSNYNTNTVLSFNFVRNLFKNKLRIYMSATIEQIKAVVEKDNHDIRYNRSEWFGFHSNSVNGALFFQGLSYLHSTNRNYDYIDVGILRNRDEIADMVTGGSEKWLIFVDSKEFGKILQSDIRDRFKAKEKLTDKNNVAFITSDYEFDPESADVVDEIVCNNKQSVKVLIATSVLDNGINIKDIELRNIIIIADTETEFIQMLGRKRKDNQRLKLYIYKHTRDHFVKRQTVNRRRRKIAEKNYREIKARIEPEVKKLEDLNLAAEGKCPNIAEINQMEKEMIWSQHTLLMQEIANNKVRFEDVKCLFMVYEGVWKLNPLSFKNLENLNQFYGHIISEFDRYGEDAFLREQLRWLNKTDEEANRIISDANIDQTEKSRKNVIKELERISGELLTKEKFIKFKNEISYDLMILIKSVGESHPDYKRYSDLVKKNDRGISVKFMDFLRENCNIPFIVESKKGEYIVKKDS